MGWQSYIPDFVGMAVASQAALAHEASNLAFVAAVGAACGLAAAFGTDFLEPKAPEGTGKVVIGAVMDSMAACVALVWLDMHIDIICENTTELPGHSHVCHEKTLKFLSGTHEAISNGGGPVMAILAGIVMTLRWWGKPAAALMGASFGMGWHAVVEAGLWQMVPGLICVWLVSYYVPEAFRGYSRRAEEAARKKVPPIVVPPKKRSPEEEAALAKEDRRYVDGLDMDNVSWRWVGRGGWTSDPPPFREQMPGLMEFLGKFAPKLERLHLDELSIGAEGLGEVLGVSFYKDTIYELGLSSNGLGDLGLSALAECDQFPGLTALRLRYNRIGNASVGKLAASSFFSKLKLLDLSENAIGPDGAAKLAASPNFPQLTALHLWNNPVGDDGLIRLADSDKFPKLKELSLSTAKITDKGAVHLSKSDNFPNLEKLFLTGNDIEDEGAMRLSRSQHFPALSLLILAGNNVSDKDVVRHGFKSSHAEGHLEL